MQPYDRAADQLRVAIEKLGPPGTRIDGLAVHFPARLSIRSAEFPGNAHMGVPAFVLRDLSGDTPVLSWLRRQPELRLATKLWGGSLRLDAVFMDQLSAALDTLPPVALTGAADAIRLEDCVEWLQLPGGWSGAVTATATGRFEPRYPTASTVNMVFEGRELQIPELDFGDVVLPPNSRATMSGSATYRDNAIEIESFTLSGTGYAMDATARIIVQQPVKSSPLRGRVALQLREMAIWRRPDVDRDVAEGMMRVLIQTHGKLHAKIGGTVDSPQAILDEAETMRSVMQGGG